nr:hypothetical protein [Candidatus Sigynarchaeota archaeon]
IPDLNPTHHAMNRDIIDVASRSTMDQLGTLVSFRDRPFFFMSVILDARVSKIDCLRIDTWRNTRS